MEKNKQWKVGILTAGLLLAGSIVFAGYFFLQKQHRKNVQREIAIMTPTTLVKDETANWKTYTSNKFSVSFKYPPTFAVDEWDSKPTGIIFVQIDLNQFSTTLTRPPRKQLTIEYADKNEVLHLFNLKVGQKYISSDEVQGATVVYTRLEDVLIGGYQAYIFDYGYETNNGESSKRIYVHVNEKFYNIDYTSSNFVSTDSDEIPGKNIDYIKTFDQILSTFKFL